MKALTRYGVRVALCSVHCGPLGGEMLTLLDPKMEWMLIAVEVFQTCALIAR